MDAGHAASLLGSDGVVVAGSVNDQATLLLVSTGLGLTSVLPDTAGAMRLPADPARRTGFGAPGTGDIRQNVIGRSLRVGGQEWSDRSLAVRPYFMPDGGAPPFGVMLAANLLRETDLELDLPVRRVIFHRPRSCQLNALPWQPAGSVPMDLHRHGTPVIAVRINGQAVRAAVDTGLNITTMTQRLATRLGITKADATGRRVRSYGTSPISKRGDIATIDEIAVGPEILRSFPVAVSGEGTGNSEELVLGQDWLMHRKVWLSFASRRLFLAPRGE